MTATAELIDDYLDRLDKAARGLPASRRVELLAEIKEHITVALAESPDQSEATVRTVLDRLGDPEDIAREAGGHPTKEDVRGERLTGTRALSAFAITVVLTVINFVLPSWDGWSVPCWPGR